MTLLLLLACSGDAEKPAPEATLPAPALEEEPSEQEETFDPRPAGLDLVPTPSHLHEKFGAHGLTGNIAQQAAQVETKPDVIVDRIAAARTGAEIGALVMEAGAADPKVMADRVVRIRSGLVAIAPEGPLITRCDTLEAAFRTGPDTQTVLALLDAEAALALDGLEAHVGPELIPLFVAGAWLQSYNLLAKAMIAADDQRLGPELLRQPEMGAYFLAYTELETDYIPSGMVQPMQDTLHRLRLATDHEPMTEEDVANIVDATEDLLGMM